jgi:predicted RNA-binding protein YlxR (DUF448 family)
VGCRKSDDRDALLRFVVAGVPPQLVPDVGRKAEGRGVSVHPSRACLEAAVRSGALRRGARAEQSASAGELAQWARVQYQRRLDGLLLSAKRSGRALLGTEAVREGIARRSVAALIVAQDAANSRDALMESAQRLGGSCIVHGDKSALGKLFGRETLAVIAVTDARLAGEMYRAAQSAASLAEAS